MAEDELQWAARWLKATADNLDAIGDDELTEDGEPEMMRTIATSIEEFHRQRLDMAMLVRRLCGRLPAKSRVRTQALDYLKRKRLQGSPLR